MTEITLLHYWEDLTDKQRRLIWDILRGHSSKRRNLAMGLLPFIPITEIKDLLLQQPLSPWSDYLLAGKYNGRSTWEVEHSSKRYDASRIHDRKDYSTILKVLSKKPDPPTKLGVLLEQWKEKNSHA